MRHYSSKNLTPLSRINRDSKPKKRSFANGQAKLIGLIVIWGLMVMAIIQIGVR